MMTRFSWLFFLLWGAPALLFWSANSATAMPKTGQYLYQGFFSGVWESPSGALFVSGEHGLLRIEEKADTWASPEGPLYSVSGDASRVFAVGALGRVVSSFDGGKSFSSQTLTNSTLYHVWLTSKKVYVLSDDTVFHSSDGKSFQKSLPPSAVRLKAIWGVEDALYLAAENGLYLSKDGGLSWSLQTKGKFQGVFGRSPKEIYAIGESQVFSSKGDGAWSEIFEDKASYFRGLWVSPTGDIYVAAGLGRVIIREKAVFRVEENVGVATNFLAISGPYLAGEHGCLLQKSVTGWTTLRANPFAQLNARIDVDAWTDALALMSGENGLIARSTDGGRQFVVVDSKTSATLSLIASNQKGAFVAVGAGGVITTSSDEGQTWALQKSGTKEDLSAVTSAGGLFYAVGAKGTALTSKNGGVTWSASKSLTSKRLEAVAGDDKGHVYAAGEAGTVLFSQNFGKTWSLAKSGVSFDFYRIVLDEGEVVIEGASKCKAIESSDFGKTWSQRRCEIFPKKF